MFNPALPSDITRVPIRRCHLGYCRFPGALERITPAFLETTCDQF